MTEASATLEELLHARETLIADIVGNMPPGHRRFLVSFKRGEPEWALLNVPGAETNQGPTFQGASQWQPLPSTSTRRSN
jgi:hypothetical protein